MSTLIALIAIVGLIVAMQKLNNNTFKKSPKVAKDVVVKTSKATKKAVNTKKAAVKKAPAKKSAKKVAAKKAAKKASAKKK